MKYVLNLKCNVPYNSQDLQENNSHIFIITEIINNCKSATLSRKIRTNFDKLKLDRVNADYRNMIFTDLESLDCIDLSKSIHALLKQQFGAL
jgi:hypothetical protein